MRRRLPILVFFALAAMAAVALAQVGKAPGARAATVGTSGSFEISDSRDGQPVFAAAGIAPGGAARGTVAVEDPGSEPVALTLQRGELNDEPGVGGGVLSGRLLLSVVDVSQPAAPRAVYSGPLDSMPEQAVGELEPGQVRTFEFTATLPEGGGPSFQNAVQGASTTVAYSWLANEVEEGKQEGGGTGVEAPGAGPTAGRRAVPYTPAGGGESDAGGAGGETPLNLVVPKIRGKLRRGRLVAWTDCDKACHLTVRGRLRAAGDGRRRVVRFRFARKALYAPGERRLRIPIPRALRRWLRATPGRERVRGRLRFVAVGTDGERDIVRKTVKLRVRRR